MTNEDKIYLVKWTVALEAEGESFAGKLGVAFVLVNRMEKWSKSVTDVCFAANQFECWTPTNPLRLGHITDAVLMQSERAARMAIGHEVPDPTDGAIYYINEELVLQRSGHLPNWWTHVAKTVKIGLHQFAKDQ